ncbi:MAG: nitroreductase family protein [Planctomycetes bacterium]|nr:nitroreductase family protein [Planctomycetota bacterium]
MKRLAILGIVLVCFATLCLGQRRTRSPQKIVRLTKPKLTGTVTFEEALSKRRSVRLFANKPLESEQIGQLAWAGQGITEKQRGLRTAPSAGETYPIELYFATEEGLFVYRPAEHSLEQTSDKDIRGSLATAASMQESVAMAGCDIIVAGSVRKLTTQFRNKARTFMLLEAGHVAQNILLQAACLDLGSVPVGSFTSAKQVGRACRLPAGFEPIYIICVGHPIEQAAAEASTNQEGTGVKRAALIVASQNYRDEELFETKRTLDAAGIQTVIASTRIGIIRGTLGSVAEANILIGQLKVDDYNAIIFIGGIGAAEYVANPIALNLAREAVRKRKILAAIGTAPTILANAGVLTGVRATSLLSERNRLLLSGAVYTGLAVEQDRLIITGIGPVASLQFGRTVADAITGR